MPARFLQFHTLTSYPAALLNRDDAGFAKRLPFGGAIRTRVSSQCLKRHWRTFAGEHSLRALEPGVSIRSREIFEKVIQPKLVEAGLSSERAAMMAQVLKVAVLKGEKGLKGGDKGAKRGRKGKEEKVEDAGDADGAAEAMAEIESQVIPIGPKEVAYLVSIGVEIGRQAGDVAAAKKAMLDRLGDAGFENLRALKAHAGIDAALFGRMVTSDILARCDAAVHVAHAFTVHAEASEADYFTAVDDLVSDAGELGAGHVNSAELTSGIYYGYVVVDVPLLVSNVTGCEQRDWERADRSLAARVVESLVHLIATVSPGAKLGSTAPHSFAHFMLVEAGKRQPCTLANAFLEPVRLQGDVMARAFRALAQEVCDLDWNYPDRPERAYMARGPEERVRHLQVVPESAQGAANDRPGALGERMHLGALASWAAHQVMR